MSKTLIRLISIYIDNYNVDIGDRYENAVYQVLDTILGEKATAIEIDYLDIGNLSSYDSDKNGLSELVDLPEYIEWKKAKV